MKLRKVDEEEYVTAHTKIGWFKENLNARERSSSMKLKSMSLRQ
jgi:hypothetical protein